MNALIRKLNNIFRLKIGLQQETDNTYQTSDFILRQKIGDLTQSYDKSPYTNRNVKGTK